MEILLLNQKARFNPYGRPSPCSLRGAINAYEMQELKWVIKASITSYECELWQHEDDKDAWMVFTMDLDLPISTESGTYGCMDTTMADDEAWWYQYQSPKKRKLVRGLHACVNKYIDHHCEIRHAGTEQLRKHMYIALQSALLDVDVDEIMLSEASSDEAQVGKHSGFQQDCLTSLMVTQRILNGINYIIPHGVK
ncbi:uncharacterized protein EDB93DRAFT_1103006 [Suillus bovinus]|uniref:uncharacterized protein n=1 Tax=Suillus bovinus TaxID=48563 RepID=UPI001B8733D9|nr:uncharacterized protein EDB93DRAFT_1103006 [Suillus bovinus]KAG2151553.1 hypothetical protein EDB93DRAFT_1103006 [Suillus bovinus]